MLLLLLLLMMMMMMDPPSAPFCPGCNDNDGSSYFHTITLAASDHHSLLHYHDRGVRPSSLSIAIGKSGGSRSDSIVRPMRPYCY